MIHTCFNENHKKINSILESEIRKLGGEKTNKTNFKIILTGGYANFFKNSIKKKVLIDQNITIKGIAKIYKKFL